MPHLVTSERDTGMRAGSGLPRPVLPAPMSARRMASFSNRVLRGPYSAAKQPNSASGGSTASLKTCTRTPYLPITLDSGADFNSVAERYKAGTASPTSSLSKHCSCMNKAGSLMPRARVLDKPCEGPVPGGRPERPGALPPPAAALRAQPVRPRSDHANGAAKRPPRQPQTPPHPSSSLQM